MRRPRIQRAVSLVRCTLYNDLVPDGIKRFWTHAPYGDRALLERVTDGPRPAAAACVMTLTVKHPHPDDDPRAAAAAWPPQPLPEAMIVIDNSCARAPWPAALDGPRTTR